MQAYLRFTLGLWAFFGLSQADTFYNWGSTGISTTSGSCPSGFKAAKFMCYTSIYKGSTFAEAHAECEKLGARLMPVGKLRYFKQENIKSIPNQNYGWFRLCAQKTASGWQEKHSNGSMVPLLNPYFPKVNDTAGKAGDTLVYHPAYPNELYIVKDSISKSGQYLLQPLCYKPKPETEICEKSKQGCCESGDCISGQCVCYSGFLPAKNCCCKEIKATLNLGVSNANKNVTVTINDVSTIYTTDSTGKVVVSGCEQGTLLARSITSQISLMSGTIKVPGFCETTFSVTSSGSEMSLSLKQSKVTFNIGKANTKATVKIDGKSTDFTSDLNGKFEMETCNSGKTGTIKVEGHCETPFTISESSNEITITPKQAGMLTLIVVNKHDNKRVMHRAVIVDGKELLSDVNGIIKLEKCIDQIVEVTLIPTVKSCTSKTEKIKVTGKETVRILACQWMSELDVKVKDAKTCQNVDNVKVISTKTNNGQFPPSFTTAYPPYTVVFKDCLKFKSKLTASKEGYCTTIEEVKRVGEVTTKELLLREHQDVKVVVRDQNNKPVEDITVLLVSENENRKMNVTSFLGETTFADLCYGQDALITVNGASFDNEHCQDKKVPIKVGQALSYTVKIDC